ncbi:2-Methylisocitrate lyase, PEP mutase family [Promicromonospora umidemergens]|uniref:Isocitrate lyase/phosphoenolpyruvate mutase family protein n=1 Tax=Promicromonospora umidemergens TaxID=629679 RepID=A0ABP8X8S8_9MICO|nr:isocitrate lyase/phosphoenolpyruvate mutase family protein [Promicromonospora umidemergens]MCP2281422.1 2-Methylisocitrate lyase, PEP mutase family [Promicromonospora umidemergens]
MTFADLHHGPHPLLLPNAWDVASALAFAEAGFPAVGTTSFGVSAAVGTPDAGRTSRRATEELVRRLSALPAYVTADLEDCYSDDPAEVADFVALLADTNLAGINIEDSTFGELTTPAAHAAKVTAIKAATPDVFVNARVETYWLNQDATVEATLDRARAYVDAGADGIFVPGATEPDVLERLASALPLPLNVLAVPGLSLERLGELGVRRVSTGSLPYRAAIDAAVAVATAVRDGGATPSATPYPQAQARLERYAQRGGDQR